tara:strand:+ start:62 stop:298 length:237 start_codon:yes stop_codon:yes gene_type:complete
MAYKPKNKIKEEIKIEIDAISEKISQLEQLPNAKLHQVISFIKSGMRIIGYCFIPYNLGIAALILVLSEAAGVVEELV